MHTQINKVFWAQIQCSFHQSLHIVEFPHTYSEFTYSECFTPSFSPTPACRSLNKVFVAGKSFEQNQSRPEGGWVFLEGQASGRKERQNLISLHGDPQGLPWKPSFPSSSSLCTTPNFSLGILKPLNHRGRNPTPSCLAPESRLLTSPWAFPFLISTSLDFPMTPLSQPQFA